MCVQSPPSAPTHTHTRQEYRYTRARAAPRTSRGRLSVCPSIYLYLHLLSSPPPPSYSTTTFFPQLHSSRRAGHLKSSRLAPRAYHTLTVCRYIYIHYVHPLLARLGEYVSERASARARAGRVYSASSCRTCSLSFHLLLPRGFFFFCLFVVVVVFRGLLLQSSHSRYRRSCSRGRLQRALLLLLLPLLLPAPLVVTIIPLLLMLFRRGNVPRITLTAHCPPRRPLVFVLIIFPLTPLALSLYLRALILLLLLLPPLMHTERVELLLQR